tara:strand:- start:1273 stop:1557 length:285 start_codon:yes stop_codon:yes gene_type:complete
MVIDILVWSITCLSLACNGILVWYIRKLISIQEDISTELAENIGVFQGELESLLNTDVLTGEPTLVKLLDDVREFGATTEELKLRLIPNEEDEE